MIRPHAKLKDWFVVDMETAKPVYGRPGMKLEGSNALLPRNMLPLIETPEAIRALTRVATSDAWAKRDAIVDELGFKLRVTQHQAIDFIKPLRGALLGDEMRLGKTVSALMCHDPARGPLVVVAPKQTRAVWVGWMRRIFPQFADEISVLKGRKFDREKIEGKPLIWANYDIVQSWQSTMKIGTLVLDEAHLVVNIKTLRTKGCAFMAAYSQKVIALTGTPIWDLPSDLWSVLQMLNPGAWGDRYSFCQRYGAPQATAHGTIYTGLSNGPELRLRMSEVMLRRLWKDHHEEVPPITRNVVVADLKDIETRNKLDILAAAIKSERSNTAANLAAYRRRLADFKAPVVRDLITSKYTDRGLPVVVWTWHKDFADKLGESIKGAKAYVVHGEISSNEREKRIEAWKLDPTGVLIATLATLSAGVNLAHATGTIFAEIDWTPAIIGQAEMRTFDQSRPMDVYFVIADHIVDQRMVRALIHKLSASNPLGVGAAIDAIDALRDAILGPEEVGDLDRLLEDLLASVT